MAEKPIEWKVPFFRHDLGRRELDSVAAVLAGSILSTGEVTAEFERRFAAQLGRRHAIGTKSCTAALHLTLSAIGIGAGDEVITTSMSWIATTAAILQTGATPVFVDVEADTGNIDCTKIAAAITPRTRAILPVHLSGLMCDMRALRSIADHHGLFLIEDAAHCVEGERDGVRPGELSTAACFSFYATKTMTCGEGGAVVCDDDALRESLLQLRLLGVTRSGADRDREGYRGWDIVRLGHKENMGNIEAALLLPQFGRLAENLARRLRLAERYSQALRTIPDIVVPSSRPNALHARCMFPIWVETMSRDVLIEKLRSERINCSVHYLPIHLTRYMIQRFRYRRGSLPITESIGDRALSLPFYSTMPDEQVDIVVEAIAKAIAEAPVRKPSAATISK